MRIYFCLLMLLGAGGVAGQSFYLFVGTYTNMGNLTGGGKLDSTGSRGIYCYKFDADHGSASPLSYTEGVCNPSYLSVAPDGQHLYACTDSRMLYEGSVSAFSFDRAAGKLHFINKQSSEGDNPAYVSVSPSGRWVAVANYTGGSLSIYPVSGDGSLGGARQNIFHSGHSIDSLRQEKSHVHSVVFAPDERYLYVQDLGTDKIMVYRFDDAGSQPLSPARIDAAGGGGVKRTPPGDGTGTRPGEQPFDSSVIIINGGSRDYIRVLLGSGPRHLVFHPNGKWGYLINELGGTVGVYSYHPESGLLERQQLVPAHEADNKGPFRSADIHISGDGRFLYASNRAENNIAIFSIDGETGLLKSVGYQSVLGKEPRNFTLDPTGRWLLVANQDSNTVVVFRVDPKTGLLQPTGAQLHVPSPTCLKMMP